MDFREDFEQLQDRSTHTVQPDWAAPAHCMQKRTFSFAHRFIRSKTAPILTADAAVLCSASCVLTLSRASCPSKVAVKYFLRPSTNSCEPQRPFTTRNRGAWGQRKNEARAVRSLWTVRSHHANPDRCTCESLCNVGDGRHLERDFAIG